MIRKVASATGELTGQRAERFQQIQQLFQSASVSPLVVPSSGSRRSER